METTRIPREARLSKWAGILKTRQESGQTVRKYCDINKISKRSYYYWQKKLRANTCEKELSRRETAPTGWVLYTPPPPSKTNADKSRLTIEIGGCFIHVNERAEPELIAEACRILRSLC